MLRLARFAGASLIAFDVGGGFFHLAPMGGSHLAQTGLFFGAAFAIYEGWRVIVSWLHPGADQAEDDA